MDDRTRAARRTTGRPLRRLRPVTTLLVGGLLLGACSVGTPDAGTAPSTPAAEPAVVTTAPGPTRPTPSPDRTPVAPAPTSTRSPSPDESPAPTPGPSPSDTATPSPSETATPAPEPTPDEPHAWRVGDEGPEVLALQERLIELGYFLPAADGDFGPATQQAVWALQKAAGLRRDGLVGPATQGALDAGTRPQARSSTGRVIEVDLARQLVLAVDDGVVTRTINASSGNGEIYVALGRTLRAITPTGDWTLVRQIDALHESGLELGPMYRPKYFHKGWAVHGSPSIPPWPASHGCVRVSNRAMDWIWDVWGAPLGTPVLVY